jgi:hypothetical protein
MAAKTFPRKRLFVDPKVQGTLILRVVLYWIVLLVTLTLLLLCWRIFTGPARPFYTHFDAMWFQFGPAMVGSFLLLPLVVFDILRVSNRFAGPLFRLRRSLRALARGEPVRPISFREGDFWIEVAHEFNAVLARFEHETPKPSEGNGKSEQEPVGAAAE